MQNLHAQVQLPSALLLTALPRALSAAATRSGLAAPCWAFRQASATLVGTWQALQSGAVLQTTESSPAERSWPSPPGCSGDAAAVPGVRAGDHEKQRGLPRMVTQGLPCLTSSSWRCVHHDSTHVTCENAQPPTDGSGRRRGWKEREEEKNQEEKTENATHETRLAVVMGDCVLHQIKEEALGVAAAGANTDPTRPRVSCTGSFRRWRSSASARSGSWVAGSLVLHRLGPHLGGRRGGRCLGAAAGGEDVVWVGLAEGEGLGGGADHLRCTEGRDHVQQLGTLASQLGVHAGPSGRRPKFFQEGPRPATPRPTFMSHTRPASSNSGPSGWEM